MSESTKISWAQHTGGPFLGCSKVSEGCANCYAAELANSKSPVSFGRVMRKAYKAAGVPRWETCSLWGENAPRVVTKSFWSDARSINKKHEKAGTRGRWFPSLIDWLDPMPAGLITQDGKWLDPSHILADFLMLIHETPNIDWLLLTKRPENFLELVTKARQLTPVKSSARAMLTEWTHYENPSAPKNVWVGVSAENQKAADDRIPSLLNIPATVRFLSCEPLLGPIDFRKVPGFNQVGLNLSNFWVIVGGESGSKARPMHPAWARSLRDQCENARVPFHFKQWGCFREATAEDFDNPRIKIGWVQIDGKTHNDEHPRQGTDELMILQSAEKNGRLLDGVLHDAFPLGH